MRKWYPFDRSVGVRIGARRRIREGFRFATRDSGFELARSHCFAVAVVVVASGNCYNCEILGLGIASAETLLVLDRGWARICENPKKKTSVKPTPSEHEGANATTIARRWLVPILGFSSWFQFLIFLAKFYFFSAQTI